MQISDVCAVALAFVFSCSSISPCTPAILDETQHSLEITRVDLFGQSGWTSQGVSVSGLRLGMTKEEVSRIAVQQNFKIVDPLNEKSACEKGRCELRSQCGRPLGVDLVFGDEGKLKEISLDSFREYSENGGPAWAQDVLAHKLHGRTYDLLNNFSEALCRRLLGQESRKEQKVKAPFTYVSAVYDKRGIVVRYEVDSRAKDTYGDVSLAFVPPAAD
jgi:hypothetical protein